jgi:hypothetical protein
MKKIKGDKPTGVIIHIYIEIPQETPCVDTFISCFSFYLFSYKIRE